MCALPSPKLACNHAPAEDAYTPLRALSSFPQFAAAVMEALSALALDQPSCATLMLVVPPAVPLTLSSGSGAAAASSPRRPPLVARLESVMELAAARGVVGGSADEGRALLAAHVLLFVLGHSLMTQPQSAPQLQGELSPTMQPPARGAPPPLPHAALVPHASAILTLDGTGGMAASGSGPAAKKAVAAAPTSAVAAAATTAAVEVATAAPPANLYLSLEDAARLTRVNLPPPPPNRTATATKTTAPGAVPSAADPVDSSLLMLFEELAELQHTIHDVLLPRMREPNLTAACSAVAQLYQLAAGPSGSGLSHHVSGRGGGAPAAPPVVVGAQAAAARLLLAESGLVRQLVGLLGGGSSSGNGSGSGAPGGGGVRHHGDARLLTACLCLLGVMSGEPGCRRWGYAPPPCRVAILFRPSIGRGIS